MTAMPGKCMEMLLLTAMSPFTASRMWSRHTVARSHFCFGCLHESAWTLYGLTEESSESEQVSSRSGICMSVAAAVALSAPIGPLVELPKDVCEHKVGEVGALLDVRQREVLQEVVQKLDEADDLVIDLCARLHMSRHKSEVPCTVRCHAVCVW